MSSPIRNLRKGIRRLFNAKTIVIDGITVATELGPISRQVRNGLFKETYEEPERILIRKALRAGDRVLEIGGGVGLVSLVCAKICGPQNVLTYEANPKMLPVIQRNFALNNLTPNVRAKAITVSDRQVTFFISDNIISSSLHERKEGQGQGRPQTVPADPLPEVLAEWKPTALVMDVEGAETTLLPATKLEGIKNIIVELHPHVVGQEAIQTLTAHLQTQGFHQIEYRDKTAWFQRA